MLEKPFNPVLREPTPLHRRTTYIWLLRNTHQAGKDHRAEQLHREHGILDARLGCDLRSFGSAGTTLIAVVYKGKVCCQCED
jgi:hypothetical protein